MYCIYCKNQTGSTKHQCKECEKLPGDKKTVRYYPVTGKSIKDWWGIAYTGPTTTGRERH